MKFRDIALCCALLLAAVSCGGEATRVEETPQEVFVATEDNEVATGDALNAHYIVVSKEAMCLKLYDNADRLVCRFPVALGSMPGNKREEGDMRTPEGEFFIEQIQPASGWVHDRGDGNGYIRGYYGSWFLRLNTPPHHGIGIHGTNDPATVGQRVTEGGIRLRNSDLDSLQALVRVGMVVRIEPADYDLRADGIVVNSGGKAKAVMTDEVVDILPDNEGVAEVVETEKPQLTEAKTTPKQPATPKEGEVWHTVKDGELVGRIARSYGVTMADIKRLNPDLNPDRISIGQRIRISDGTTPVKTPAPQSDEGVSATVTEQGADVTVTTQTSATTTTQSVGSNDGEVWHTIADGELVGRIAIKYGTTSKRIAELNPDINIDRVSIGQRIRVK